MLNKLLAEPHFEPEFFSFYDAAHKIYVMDLKEIDFDNRNHLLRHLGALILERYVDPYRFNIVLKDETIIRTKNEFVNLIEENIFVIEEGMLNALSEYMRWLEKKNKISGFSLDLYTKSSFETKCKILGIESYVVNRNLSVLAKRFEELDGL